MVNKSIVAVLGLSLAFGTVAKADQGSPFKQQYKDDIMRLNADEKNLAVELEGYFQGNAGKYRPKVTRLVQAKRDLTQRVRAYDTLCEHFTPNFKLLSKSCHDISAKTDEVKSLWSDISRDANEYGQFMKDIAAERTAFESALNRIDANTAELCKKSDQVRTDLPSGSSAVAPGAAAAASVSARSATRDSDHLHAVVTRENDDGGNITFNVRGSVKGDDWRKENSTKMVVVNKSGASREVPFSSPGGVRNLKDFNGNVTVSKAHDREVQIKTKRLGDKDSDDRDESHPIEVLTLWTNGN